MFANVGPKGLPIVTPVNYLYIWLLKLNSTPHVGYIFRLTIWLLPPNVSYSDECLMKKAFKYV